MTNIENELVLSDLQEEMAVWWMRNKAKISCLWSSLLSKKLESELEYRSGNNPLLLQGVIEALEVLKDLAYIRLGFTCLPQSSPAPGKLLRANAPNNKLRLA